MEQKYKNELVEMFSQENKEMLYNAINSGKSVYATTNRRGIPGKSVTINQGQVYLEAVVEPDARQMEYVDFQIYSIEQAVNQLMPVKELLVHKQKMKPEQFQKAISSLTHKIKHQYSTETIYEYLSNV